MTENNKYVSGIYGKAEARFGGKIFADLVQFHCVDGVDRHGIILSECYNDGEVGSTPADQRRHEPQISLVFDSMKSVEMMEVALASIRELMKRDEEKRKDRNPLFDTPLDKFTFTVRTANIIKNNGLRTIGDICGLAKLDWLKFRNGGKKSLTEIDDFLKSQGLTWGMDV